MTNPDKFRIDGHKLIFHPKRLAQWLNGELIYPVYLEISPSGACNHRCTFCAKDYLEYLPQFLDVDNLLERLTEFGSLGIRSIMFAGDGEPLLHPDIAKIILHSHSSGIDTALSTNGVRLTPELSEQILPVMSWVKVSINAGTPGSYSAVHRTRTDDFQKVIDNMTSASRLIHENGWRCTLGAQALLLPENATEMETLAELVRDSGASYLVIKPYSQHHMSITCRYADIDYTPYLDLQKRLARFNNNNFSVIFRMNTMMKMQRKERGYDRCLALPFWSYLDSAGNIWACNSYIGDERFLYGNIYEESFSSIWSGDRRRRSLELVSKGLDTEECRMNCRMDEVNLYLWELTHPGPHVNFI
jgi:radical SAM protein with 4Fe4S-binding SPASM domain